MHYTASYESPLGQILMASDGRALTGLWFMGQRYCAAGLTAHTRQQNLPVFKHTIIWLENYFSGSKIAHTAAPPLNIKATPFQKIVWRLLCDIPYGSTVTYGNLATRVAAEIGKEKMSAQAIGTAVGRNPFALIIPCHRVLPADGSLGNYAAGKERKLKLLLLENPHLKILHTEENHYAENKRH